MSLFPEMHAGTVPLHCHVPPFRHAPYGDEFTLHAWPMFDGAPLQLPHTPFPHTCVPALQLPHPRDVPLMQVQPSFATPLQLSSLPGSHVSFAFAVMLHE